MATMLYSCFKWPHCLFGHNNDMLPESKVGLFYLYATALSEIQICSRPRGNKIEYSLKIKIKCNDWLLANTCPQASNKCTSFWVQWVILTIEARSRISTDRELFYSSIGLVLFYKCKYPPTVLTTYTVGAKSMSLLWVLRQKGMLFSTLLI